MSFYWGKTDSARPQNWKQNGSWVLGLKSVDDCCRLHPLSAPTIAHAFVIVISNRISINLNDDICNSIMISLKNNTIEFNLIIMLCAMLSQFPMPLPCWRAFTKRTIEWNDPSKPKEVLMPITPLWLQQNRTDLLEIVAAMVCRVKKWARVVGCVEHKICYIGISMYIQNQGCAKSVPHHLQHCGNSLYLGRPDKTIARIYLYHLITKCLM